MYMATCVYQNKRFSFFLIGILSSRRYLFPLGKIFLIIWGSCTCACLSASSLIQSWENHVFFHHFVASTNILCWVLCIHFCLCLNAIISLIWALLNTLNSQIFKDSLRLIKAYWVQSFTRSVDWGPHFVICWLIFRKMYFEVFRCYVHKHNMYKTD